MINIKLSFRLFIINLTHNIITTLLIAFIMFLLTSVVSGFVSTKKILNTCAGLEEKHGIYMSRSPFDNKEEWDKRVNSLQKVREIYTMSYKGFFTIGGESSTLSSSLISTNINFLKSLDIPLAKGSWFDQAESEGCINVVVSRDFGYNVGDIVECIGLDNQKFSLKVTGIMKNTTYYPKFNTQIPYTLEGNIISEYKAFNEDNNIKPILIISAYNSIISAPTNPNSGIFIFESEEASDNAKAIIGSLGFSSLLSEMFGNTKRFVSYNSKIYLPIALFVFIIVNLTLVSAAFISFDKGYKIIYIFYMLGCNRKNILLSILGYFAIIYILALIPYAIMTITIYNPLVTLGIQTKSILAGIVAPLVFYTASFGLLAGIAINKSKKIIKLAARRAYAK